MEMDSNFACGQYFHYKYILTLSPRGFNYAWVFFAIDTKI